LNAAVWFRLGLLIALLLLRAISSPIRAGPSLKRQSHFPEPALDRRESDAHNNKCIRVHILEMDLPIGRTEHLVTCSG
jgi:hypothetical protein